MIYTRKTHNIFYRNQSTEYLSPQSKEYTQYLAQAPETGAVDNQLVCVTADGTTGTYTESTIFGLVNQGGELDGVEYCGVPQGTIDSVVKAGEKDPQFQAKIDSIPSTGISATQMRQLRTEAIDINTEREENTQTETTQIETENKQRAIESQQAPQDTINIPRQQFESSDIIPSAALVLMAWKVSSLGISGLKKINIGKKINKVFADEREATFSPQDSVELEPVPEVVEIDMQPFDASDNTKFGEFAPIKQDLWESIVQKYPVLAEKETQNTKSIFRDLFAWYANWCRDKNQQFDPNYFKTQLLKRVESSLPNLENASPEFIDTSAGVDSIPQQIDKQNIIRDIVDKHQELRENITDETYDQILAEYSNDCVDNNKNFSVYEFRRLLTNQASAKLNAYETENPDTYNLQDSDRVKELRKRILFLSPAVTGFKMHDTNKTEVKPWNAKTDQVMRGYFEKCIKDGNFDLKAYTLLLNSFVQGRKTGVGEFVDNVKRFVWHLKRAPRNDFTNVGMEYARKRLKDYE